MSIEDKHFEHIAKMQAIRDMDKWSSWGSPIGLTIFFLGFVVFINGFALFAMLIKYVFLMK
ncbi:MAG TPA: hypothetical protein VLG12_01635 [Candidatus Saccharimonadales bacterium]|nr:hypothetical protein [Candidatus Saccharimonadales bacterium]